MCFSSPEAPPMDICKPLSDDDIREVRDWLPPGMAFEKHQID